MIITIHQPDMLPWLGFFYKIAQADLWVILDHTTNNPRDAAFWGRRVKILVNGEGKWLSLPLKRPDTSGIIGLPISMIQFNDANPKVYSDAVRTVELNYKRTPHFREIFPIVESFLLSKEMGMSNRNLCFIFRIMELLEIKTNVSYSSEMDCKENATELLIEILKKNNGTTYLSGAGAGGYQKDDLFTAHGIEVKYIEFVHPIYSQVGSKDFIPGLSIIDTLMNIGVKKTQEIINITD